MNISKPIKTLVSLFVTIVGVILIAISSFLIFQKYQLTQIQSSSILEEGSWNDRLFMEYSVITNIENDNLTFRNNLKYEDIIKYYEQEMKEESWQLLEKKILSSKAVLLRYFRMSRISSGQYCVNISIEDDLLLKARVVGISGESCFIDP